MSKKTPETRTMTFSDFRRTLSSLVNEVYRGGTRVLIEKSGIPVAVLVSVADLERLARFEDEQAARREAIDAISAAFEDIPLDEIERELAKIASEERERRFTVIDQMREAFKDVPPEEIERNVVAIIREIREADEAAIRAKEQAAGRQPAVLLLPDADRWETVSDHRIGS